jgi:hypothetical protein
MTRLSKILFAATLVAAPMTAFADDPPADGTAGTGADTTAGAGVNADGTTTAPATPTGDANVDVVAGGATGLTLMKGKLLIGGETLNIGLFPDNAGKPLSIAPSIWYGVSDKLTVGVTHDGGTTSWTPRPSIGFATGSILGVPISIPNGNGICLSGTDGLCAKVYNNISVDGLFSLKAEKFSLAAHPALDVGSFDPLVLSLRIGALGTFAAADKITIAFDPRIKIGLTERDGGNKETIDVPVWFWYHLNEKMGVAVNTGISGPLDGFGDAFFVPVGFNFTYKANEKLSVGADFSFLNLIGKNGDADAKMLGVRASYAL